MEKKVMCIRPGNKNLTLYGVYDVIGEREDAYIITDDEGKTAPFYKWRFEVVKEPIKKVMAISDNVIKGITSYKTYDVYKETDTMYELANDYGDFIDDYKSHYVDADSVKKVVCIDAVGGEFALTEGKEYLAVKEKGDVYFIINDNGNINSYHKSRFVELDKAKKIACIDNADRRMHLTVGKKYTVLKEIGNSYFVINDAGEYQGYLKKRFIPEGDVVPRSSQEEKKEETQMTQKEKERTYTFPTKYGLKKIVIENPVSVTEEGKYHKVWLEDGSFKLVPPGWIELTVRPS